MSFSGVLILHALFFSFLCANEPSPHFSLPFVCRYKPIEEDGYRGDDEELSGLFSGINQHFDDAGELSLPDEQSAKLTGPRV